MNCAVQRGTPIATAVVDPHPIFRYGVRMLLESWPGISVVAEGTNDLDATAIVGRYQPDLLLMDLCMPDADGLECLRRLRDMQHATRTVILAANISREQTLEALQLGAWGVLPKSSTSELLLRCIRAVTAGDYWVNRQAAADLVGALRLQRQSEQNPAVAPLRLSATERRIVAALRNGATNKLIARELRMAEQTVKNRLSRLYARFSASNRLDLTLKLARMGVLTEHADALRSSSGTQVPASPVRWGHSQ
jgi:two-component system, NarL family, nitrate/nitrite response regulator NarL